MPGYDREHQDADIENESRRFALAFLDGEQGAFDRLIILHQRVVFSLCLRLLGDYDDADDCAQEVFIKVHRYLGKFRFESSFRTWLYRITVNTCKNRLASREYRSRMKKVSIEDRDGTGVGSEEVIRDNSPSPLSLIGRKEMAKMIENAINTLSGSQKLVVVLKDMEGASYQEISDITGLKAGTVKSSLSRARLKLREVIKGMISDEMR
ncbi:MAG: sigma-70 family RNA polymerase sigma factor [Candidatus Krumholzibacteriota bacterium]|nr:sigma-70 family RNA polymerase sigma factor [Candidatus Krumholzibacteriota bacterium]